MVKTSELSQCLQTAHLFQRLSPSQLDCFVRIAQLKSFSKGESIFKQGSEANGFFVVKTGRVKVFKLSSQGKEQILNIFQTGEHFAEVAALDGKPFPASAAALDSAELIFFPRIAFLELLHQHPKLAIDMLIGLSQHSRHLAQVIEELSFKEVPQRLAAYLLDLNQSHAKASSDNIPSHPDKRSTPVEVVTLDLTKSQLAATLGTISATLSRAFSRLSSEGLIAVKGSKIELLDRARLEQWSQSIEQDPSRNAD